MPRFDKNNAEQLKEFLYSSCVHDAKLENIRYDYEENIIKVNLFNSIFKVKIDLTFYDIGISLAIKGENFGNRETIISLTIEEDFSYLPIDFSKYTGLDETSIYLLFQMFSGDELHIVSKEVIIEITM